MQFTTCGSSPALVSLISPHLNSLYRGTRIFLVFLVVVDIDGGPLT